MLSLQSTREILAAKFYSFGFKKLGCFTRGRHMSRERVGYCLACGSMKPGLKEVTQTLAKKRTAHYGKAVTPYSRNKRIREDANTYGL